MKYKLANRIVDIEAVTGIVADDMLAYIYNEDGAAQHEIRITPQDIIAERERQQPFIDAALETQILIREFSSWLIDNAGTYIHANAIEMDGWAYIFTADSGTGKSTHCSLWKQVFGRERIRVLNDDKPFVIRGEGGDYFACGSPWCGKVPENTNAQAPLAGICVLKQAKDNSISRLDHENAVLALYRQAYVPDDEDRANKLFDLLEGLVDSVPVYELSCNISEDAARLAYKTMCPEVKRL